VADARKDDSSNLFVFLYGWNVTDHNETGTPTAYSNLSLRVRVLSNTTCPYFDGELTPVTGNTTINPPPPPPPPSYTMRRLLAPSTTQDVCSYIRDGDFSTGFDAPALMYIETDADVDIIAHVEMVDSVSVSMMDSFISTPSLRTVGTLSTGTDNFVTNVACPEGQWSVTGNMCPGVRSGISWRYYAETGACLWWHADTKK